MGQERLCNFPVPPKTDGSADTAPRTPTDQELANTYREMTGRGVSGTTALNVILSKVSGRSGITRTQR